MASGPAASTRENTNYARLCRLLVDVGGSVLRDTFNSIHPPASLHVVLSSPAVFSTLQSLQQKKFLKRLQWGKLFPAVASTVSSANFDVTLLMVLLRNICYLSPPVSTGNWEDLPPDFDSSTEANIVRINWYRNNVYAHVIKASVDDATFEALWHKISEAILALKPGYGIDIMGLKTECMDPTAEAHYKKLLSDWKKDDDNLKEMLERIHDTLGEIRENQERTHIELGDLKENQERTHIELEGLKEMVKQLQACEWSTTESLKVEREVVKQAQPCEGNNKEWLNDERDLSEEKKMVGDKGARALAKMLEGNKTLTELNLNIKRTGDKGVVALAEALEDSKVRELSFKFDEIGDEGTATLAKMLEKNSKLTELHLSVSKIGDQAAGALAEALTRNSALTKLNLRFNNIGDSGAAALAEALKKNTALTELKLIMNGVSDEGAEALGKALTENSMIKKLNVSFNDTGN